jgi:DNA-binding beta-propeller fold protein YncE
LNLRTDLTARISISLKAVPVFFFLLLSPLFLTDNAYGIRLTYVTHLFDITHDFSQPSDVSVSDEGMIYVLDGVNNQVKVFDNNGTFRFSFGRKGSSTGHFMFPMGIDVDSSGLVYIADSGNQRVQVFSPEGKYIKQFRIPPEGNTPSDPTDVIADTVNKKLFVADNDNHYILIFDLETTKLIDTFGGPGSEETEFRYPFLMAQYDNYYLYVTDVINTRVQVFTHEGKFVTVIGGWGVDKGRFFRPKGVATNRDNRIFVTDSYMGVIQVFQHNGEFFSVLGDPETESVKKFIKPMGMFIDRNNRLYLVEMFADRVSIYKIEDDNQ